MTSKPEGSASTDSSAPKSETKLTLGTLHTKSSGTTGGLKGLGSKKDSVEIYAPKNSEMEAFLKPTPTTGKAPESTTSYSSSNYRYTPVKTNASYICDIDISGVNCDDLFTYKSN